MLDKAVYPVDIIVTHSGIFHADELMGIALIQSVIPDIAVVRTTDASHHLYNVRTLVLDIGGKYDMALNNLDHHHDPNVPSAVILAARWLEFHRLISHEYYVYLTDANSLFREIDKIDRNGYEGQPMNTFNSIIRSLNGLPDDFRTALDLCKTVLAGIRNTFDMRQRALEAWGKAEHFDGYVIWDSKEPIIGWKEFAEDQDVLMLLVPGRTQGAWKIISRSTDVLVIPKHKYQSFRHNSGFVAEYYSFEQAVEHAKELAAE